LIITDGQNLAKTDRNWTEIWHRPLGHNRWAYNAKIEGIRLTQDPLDHKRWAKWAKIGG
jgi:hypothetical protein